jgi:hypothetical protein
LQGDGRRRAPRGVESPRMWDGIRAEPGEATMAPLSPRAAPRHRRLPAWCVCVTHRRRLDYAQMRISHHTSTFGYQLELQRLESVSPAARTSPARGPRERVRTCAVICFLSRDGVLWPPSNTIPAAQKSSPSIESVGTERVPYRVPRAVVPLALPQQDHAWTLHVVRTWFSNNGTSVPRHP